jgi:hypothetical protein
MLNLCHIYAIYVFIVTILQLERYLKLSTISRKEVIQMAKNQHIVPTGNGWGVRGEGNSRLTVVKPTQREAIEAGREIARNQGSELITHGRDGRIRERDSYGNDPYPPKG